MQDPQFLKWTHNFWKTPPPRKKGLPDPPKKWKWGPPKKSFPESTMACTFCKKPGPIWYILASGASFLIYTPPIGGPHPVLYFPSQRNIVQRCAISQCASLSVMCWSFATFKKRIFKGFNLICLEEVCSFGPHWQPPSGGAPTPARFVKRTHFCYFLKLNKSKKSTHREDPLSLKGKAALFTQTARASQRENGCRLI